MFKLPSIPSYDVCMLEVTAGRVTARTSQDGHFTIFNYTQQTSVCKEWNDVNRWCRGLIFDEHTHEIVAVPFYKFFTLGQMPEVSYEALVSYGPPRRVANKEDGSLGIMFWDKYNRRLRVSTRGSLDSEQAVWATNWVCDLEEFSHENESQYLSVLGKSGWTYQFEIIYRENRIVIDYGDFQGLICLARVNNETGAVDYDLSQLPPTWAKTKTFNGFVLDDIISLKKYLTWEVEGWVLTYDNGLMVKVKTDDYVRIHAIRFAMTPSTILKIVQDQKDPFVVVEDLPDEFTDDVRAIVERIEKKFAELRDEFLTLASDGLAEMPNRSRKENAVWCLENLPQRFQSAFFHIVSGRGFPRKILLEKITVSDIS